MKEFKPEAILIRLSVERSAARLAESEMRRYQIEKVKNAEMLIDDPDFIPEFTDDLTGDLLEMAWDTIKAGIETARAKHYANTSGKKKQSSPENLPDTHRVPIDHPKGTHRPPNTYIHSNIHTFNHSDNIESCQEIKPDTDREQEPERYTSGISDNDKITSLPDETREKKRTRFTPPTVEEVTAECREKGYTVNPQIFFDHYESNGWMVGKVHMKNWRAALRNWQSKEQKGGFTNGSNGRTSSGTSSGDAGKPAPDYSILDQFILRSQDC